jgi:serine/threonine protein kinase/tetratricopeptide (TPR) repeat protein
MTPERDRYEAVLESLADGADVDWTALESSAATSADRRRYRNLRLVARVAELHRTLTVGEEELFRARVDDTPTGTLSTWGHLRVGQRIASGAYGEIYVAHDPQLNRDVALKLLRRGTATGQPLDQLLGEARTLAKVRHSNVVTIHGADVRDGRAGLWMELVHGQTLETWLQPHGTMGAGEVSALGVAACRALAAVHAAGLVHGDIKAQNVMRENGGRVVLMDFGAGRAQGADAVGVAGTPLYLAPEVLAGEPPTTRSDIYSVGVLHFHLLTGAYPCTADDLDGLRAAHADGVRTWLRDLRADLPDALIESIEHALDPDPARRFATAGEMERALTGVSQASALRPEPRLTRSRVFGFGVAAAIFLTTVVAFVVWSNIAESRRGVTLSKVRTIGVMPMVDLTGSTLPEHFAQGLSDELLSSLGQVSGLTVKPAVAAAQTEQRSYQVVARWLDVDALVETTLSRPGEAPDNPNVRVRARLIAAGTQGIVWSDEFDRPRGATLELTGAIANAIARAVNAAVTPAESSRLTAPRQTQPAAEDAYLQGRAHLTQYGTIAFDAALKAFQRALELDPNHAGAHSGAAVAYVRLGLDGALAHARARSSALVEVRRALELDPELAEAHATLAHIRFIYDWDWPEAEREFQRSVNLNPNSAYARIFYADDLAAMRRFNESLAQGEMAKRLEPESGAAARRYALFLYYKHDFGAAKRALEEAEQIEPNNAGLPLLQSRVAEAEGRYEDALDLAAHALALSDGGGVPLRVHQIRQQILAGKRADASTALDKLEREAAEGRIQLTTRDRAYIELAFGHKDKAIDLFARAVDERDATMVWLGVDPRLDALQHDAHFRELLRIVGIPRVP